MVITIILSVFEDRPVLRHIPLFVSAPVAAARATAAEA
jgi:hypothetical protein